MTRPDARVLRTFIPEFLEQARLGTPEVSSSRGASIEVFSARPWEFGIVPIAFDSDVTSAERERFFLACSTWASSGVVCND